MKVRISKDWFAQYVREQHGKTQAEKETRAEQIFSSPGRNWALSMNEKKGNWLDVETEHLFEDQFNVDTMRVMAKHIDGIDFMPEFKSLDEFQDAVQKQYNINWPGCKVNCNVLRHYIEQGFIEDTTTS